MKISKTNVVNYIYELYNCKYVQSNLNMPREELYDVLNKTASICLFDEGKIDFSSLDFEIIMNNKEEVLKLIKSGIDLNEVSVSGLTPLEISLSMNNYEITKILIENGADVNKYNKYYPLFLAVICKNYDAVKLLIENGADVNFCDEYGVNALHYLLDNAGVLYTGYIYLIFNYVGNRISSKYSVVEIIDLLYKYGIDVNAACKSRRNNLDVDITPMTLAVESKNSKAIEKLIECGAKKEAIEIFPENIYMYQDSFQFPYDILDGDISMWVDAPGEYLEYLKYKRNIIKYGIDVYSYKLNNGYKRPKMIKQLKK